MGPYRSLCVIKGPHVVLSPYASLYPLMGPHGSL